MVDVLGSIHRWINNHFQRSYELQFFKIYWKIKKITNNILFRIKKIRYNAKKYVESQLFNFTIFKYLIKIFLYKFIFASIIIYALILIENLLINKSSFIIPLISSIRFLDKILPLFELLLKIPSSTNSLLSSIAEISGVFLGLYFTAITVVLSTYVGVPENVRNIILKEKVSNFYINIISFVTSYSLLLLLMNIINIDIGILNIYFIIILCIISIFSFINLGIRFFEYFEPTNLTSIIRTNIYQYISSVTPDHLEWNDVSFQKHSQKLTIQNLEAYKNIVDSTLDKRKPSMRVVQDLTNSLFLLISFYNLIKHKIPSDSQWFLRKYQHKSWLTSGYPEIDLSLKTRTSLQPSLMPDHIWLERQLTQIISEMLTNSFEKKDLRSIYNISVSSTNSLKSIISNYGREECFFIYNKIMEIINIHSLTFDMDSEELKNYSKQNELILGITDIIGFSMIEIFLGFLDSLNVFTKNELIKTSKKILNGVRSPKLIYEINMPRSVIIEIEKIFSEIYFEYKIEDKVITSEWYINQRIALNCILYIDKFLKEYFLNLDSVYINIIEKYLVNKQYIKASQLSLRALENVKKISVNMSLVNKIVNDLQNMKKTDMYEWIEIDFDDYFNKTIELENIILDKMIQININLFAIKYDSSIPDYYGNVHSILLDECYKSLQNNNLEKFTKIFPTVLISCFVASETIKEKILGQNPRVFVSFVTDPILDILELSGYALIYSELHQSNIWEKTTEIWDNFLEKNKDSSQLLNYLITVMNARDRIFGISPRDVLRINWKIQLEEKLRELGLLGYRYSLRGEPEETRRHESDIIEVITRSDRIMYKAKILFLAEYICERDEIKGIEIPREVERFNEAITRMEGNPDE